MVVTRVSGFIKEGSRPVSGGWVVFFPVDGTVGNLRSARLRSDGSFDANGVAVGLNLIRLVNTSLSSRELRDLFGAYTSPIRRIIPAVPTQPLSIDVIEEAIKAQNARSRRVLPSMPGPGDAR
jgi:hypothetical protein